MAITLKNVRYFVAVAEAESISGAVQDLNISQSVVTEAIRTLEADLGATLFQRHARGMILTHAGYQFLRHAHQILASVRNAREAMRARPDTVTGQLNIGVTSLVCGYFLPYLLDRFRNTFPLVDIRVVEDQREYIEHLLVNGELDVGVLIVSNLENRQALEAETLLESAYRLWLPVNHPLLELGTVAVAEMAQQALVTLKLDELEDVATALWRSQGLRPTVAVRTSSVEGLRSLVATGAGLAVMPDLLYRPWSLDGDRLEVRQLMEKTPSLQVGLAWRRGAKVAETAQNFLTVAREYTRSHA